MNKTDTKIVLEIYNKYIHLAKKITDPELKSEESELFYNIAISRTSFERAIAFKHWKNFILKHTNNEQKS